MHVPDSGKVSIGLPVYNGERTLQKAIESLLGQTYQNLELIICDNTSTDNTESICREFASRDPRVQYHKNKKNIGSHRNHNKTVELASGDYFMWAGHDDIRLPECISSSVKVLEENPTIVLCFTATKPISQSGDTMLSESVALPGSTNELAEVRFADLIRMDHQVEAMYGLIRIDVLRTTNLFGQFADADRVLVAELVLHGPFARLCEPLLQRGIRITDGKRGYPSRQDRTIWFEPERPNMIVFPYSRQWVEYLRAIRRAPLSPTSRRACNRLMLQWLGKHILLVFSDYRKALKNLLKRVYCYMTGHGIK